MKNMQYVYEHESKIPEEDREIARYRKFIHEIEVMVGNYKRDLNGSTENTGYELGVTEVIERIEEFAKQVKLELDY